MYRPFSNCYSLSSFSRVDTRVAMDMVVRVPWAHARAPLLAPTCKPIPLESLGTNNAESHTRTPYYFFLSFLYGTVIFLFSSSADQIWPSHHFPVVCIVKSASYSALYAASKVLGIIHASPKEPSYYHPPFSGVGNRRLCHTTFRWYRSD